MALFIIRIGRHILQLPVGNERIDQIQPHGQPSDICSKKATKRIVLFKLKFAEYSYRELLRLK